MSTTLTTPGVRTAARPRRTSVWSLPEVRWASTATVLFGFGLAAHLAGGPAWLSWPSFLACYVTGGWEPGWAGLRALKDRTLDVDLLMVVAAIGAAVIGQVLDGGLLIVIFATSGALEAVATQRTADSVRGLLGLAPDTATRVTATGEEAVETSVLWVGDVILVRPGERIGADGQVIDGASDVDQATITGEGLPVTRTVGDEVFAGTSNGTGVLRVRVDRPAADTVIARIVAMVEEASATKARTQLFIEKIEQRYSVAMVTATVALFVTPLLFGADLRATLLRAMTFMIVASPCAVVLATMPPLLAAMANAGRQGVLVKSAVVMEQLGQTTAVALDKTGTLTQGSPHLADLSVLPGAVLDDKDLLALAASAENPSEHPLARAVVSAAHDAGLVLRDAEGFTSTPGRGITARIEGRLVEIGSPAHLLKGRDLEGGEADRGPAQAVERLEETGQTAVVMLQNGRDLERGEADRGPAQAVERLEETGQTAVVMLQNGRDLERGEADRGAAQAVERLEETGQTAVVMLQNGVPAAVLGIADRLRLTAADAVAALTALTGTVPILLTGDNPRAATRLAAQVGIGDVRAGLLPQDKAEAVQGLERDGQRVLLVGDGVNDAPALAAAHTGIAIGRTGSDLALDTADAVVVGDDLATIPAVIALSRHARRVVTANLAIAAMFITVLVAWDLAGHLPLPLGVLGHEGSTVIIGLNGLRLLRATAWTRALTDAKGSRR